MRTLLAAAVLLALASLARAEAVHFTSPGYYQIIDTFVGRFVRAGPFADQSTCQATLEPDNEEEEVSFACEYLKERPYWDGYGTGGG